MNSSLSQAGALLDAEASLSLETKFTLSKANKQLGSLKSRLSLLTASLNLARHLSPGLGSLRLYFNATGMSQNMARINFANSVSRKKFKLIFKDFTFYKSTLAHCHAKNELIFATVAVSTICSINLTLLNLSNLSILKALSEAELSGGTIN